MELEKVNTSVLVLILVLCFPAHTVRIIMGYAERNLLYQNK